ncbi:MAG: aminoglycoside phosphotransferase family protein [Kibdelosporangium sp.]
MIDIPDALRRFHLKEYGPEWIGALPGMAAGYLDRWRLTRTGEPMHGVVSLVLPVVQQDGTPAALKFQPVDDETVSEPIGLRIWDGDGSVRLLEHDPETGTMLLEGLHADRPLSALPDDRDATRILAEVLARLVKVPDPGNIRQLRDIAGAMVDKTPAAAAGRPREEQALLKNWAAAVEEVLDEPGDRLLHWDLHYDNVLAADREPWLAIDPKPLGGDPGFDIMPALDNRWDDIVATGDIPRAVRWRFDLMTDVLGLDRQRAVNWTLGRALQNSLWDIADGEPALRSVQIAIAQAVAAPRRWFEPGRRGNPAGPTEGTY